MVSQKTGTQTPNHGENNSMIIFGILSTMGTWDSLIHEMDEITANDAKRQNKRVNWKKTKPTNHQNKGLATAIYRERWK